MFAVYITHPQVFVNPDIQVSHWGLSCNGAEQDK